MAWSKDAIIAACAKKGYPVSFNMNKEALLRSYYDHLAGVETVAEPTPTAPPPAPPEEEPPPPPAPEEAEGGADYDPEEHPEARAAARGAVARGEFARPMPDVAPPNEAEEF